MRDIEAKILVDFGFKYDEKRDEYYLERGFQFDTVYMKHDRYVYTTVDYRGNSESKTFVTFDDVVGFINVNKTVDGTFFQKSSTPLPVEEDNSEWKKQILKEQKNVGRTERREAV